jgi:UDP-3-O-acyl N-acetylglucosamine deacetylase
VKLLGFRHQRTLARPAAVSGVGFLTGAAVRLRFLPAPPDTGVVFVRTDLSPAILLPARVDRVTDTNRRTTLGHAPQQVMLVEHVLAALAGLRVDNCVVELDAPEPPGLDGSARGFVDVLRAAGTVVQPARRPCYAVASPVVVRSPGATLALHPAEGGRPELTMSYLLNYGDLAPIAPQRHTARITPTRFAADLAGCRTFLLAAEAAALQRQGVGTHITPADLLVFGPRGPIDNRLRCADEPARHKVLDLVGDLALFGADLAGHVVAYRSGHPLNVELVRSLSGLLPAGKPERRAA